jgi:putative membrane protein
MMRIKLVAVVAMLALALFLAPLAVAQRPDQVVSDAKFVVLATAGGMAEVQFGKLAEKQASNADVRKFAEKMVEAHTKANKQLNDLAFTKKWEVAAAMDRDHQAEYDRLMRLEGADFDRMYMRDQVRDHEKVISLFENEAKNGDDAQLKAWVNKTLPHLREHLKEAKRVSDKLGGSK